MFNARRDSRKEIFSDDIRMFTVRSLVSYFRQLLIFSIEWESFIFREAQDNL